MNLRKLTGLKHLGSLAEHLKTAVVSKPNVSHIAVLKSKDLLWAPHGFIAIPTSGHDEPAYINIIPWPLAVKSDFGPNSEDVECFEMVLSWHLSCARKSPTAAPYDLFAEHMHKWREAVGAGTTKATGKLCSSF